MDTVVVTNMSLLQVAVTLLWVVSVRLRDASIIDIFWGMGFVLTAWLTWSMMGHDSSRSLLLPVLTTVWGARLSAYLLWRNHGQPEDFRYRKMRARFGVSFWWKSLSLVYWVQGALIWIVSLPIQMGMVDPDRPFGVLTAIGFALYGLGMVFETVGDLQLARFKADPANAGRVMDRGLWRYTRHPNYFGDFCVWWGLWAVAVSVGAPLWTAIGPAVLTVLLLRVSGVALLERGMSDRRPEYEAYKQRTSAFFPRPPR